MIMKYLYILLLWVVPLCTHATNFKVLDTSNQLPNSTVKCIAQDDNGFMWVGTFDGLCRFDGVHFTVFRHDFDGVSSLSKNQITSLLPVAEGIWVGSEYGLFFFSFFDQHFHSCFMRNSKNEEKQVQGYVHDIFIQDGQLYALSHELLLLDENLRFNVCPIQPQGFWSNISPYKNGQILAHNANGLFLVHPASQEIISSVLYSTSHDTDVLYYDAAKEIVYVGFGLNHPTRIFHIKENKLVPSTAAGPPNLKSVVAYNDGILFGTDGNGLLWENTDKNEVFTPENSNISSDVIYSLYVDKSNSLWVGTYRGGLNYYNKQNDWFTTYTMEKGQLKHNFVTATYRAANGILYIGLDGGGLNVYDPKSERATAYTTGNSGISGNNVLSIAGDERYIWLGIFGGALSRFDTATRTFQSYPIPAMEDSQTWVIRCDSKGRIWIGGKNGVYCFDKEKEAFVMQKKSILYASEFAFDGDFVWVSTNFDGIYKLDLSGNIIKRYHKESKEIALPNDLVRYVFVDSHHHIWFSCAYSGLCRLDEAGKKVVIYGSENGLTNPDVVSMAEDTNGYFWLGTYDGLFRFNSVTERFIRFGKEDNLPSAQFNFNASFQWEGVMYFGTTKGLVSFIPAEISYESEFNPVTFTDFQLYNGKVKLEDAYRIDESGIKLSHDKTFFTIHFSVAELALPEKIQFSYYLKNFDQEWHSAQQERKASYTNVPPGKYEFCVRATNSLGEWDEEYSSLHITIAPPWWKSIPALILWCLICLGIIGFLLWFYWHELNNKHALQLKEVEKNSINSINEAKLSFFTNITHELRTPIFLITAPLEELIASGKTNVQVPKSYLTAMFRNCMRLNKLISRIIDFRKLETGKLELELQNSNVVTFCKGIVADFEAVSEQKGIALLFMPSTLDIHLAFDLDKLETILSNLIGNALKYTMEGGRVILGINEMETDVEFTVEDNGIGIKKEYHDSIFDRFFQVDSTLAAGDGIGLSFVKNLVDLHGGVITVKSELNVGTTFRFTIPKRAWKQEVTEQQVLSKEEEKEKEIPAVNASAVHNPTAQHVILVIDDERETVEIIERSLSPSYKVIKAYNGVDGLAMVREASPDLIICDVMMPRMNGIEFLTALRNDKTIAQIPVIMFTAKTAEDDMLEAFEHGADAYLTKPVSMKFLKKRIEHLLAQSESINISSFMTDSKANYSKEEKKFLFRCKLIIDENLTNADFDVMLFAQKLGMSHSSLYKKVKGLTGKSVIEFINEYRIYKALQCFMEGKTSISLVCSECGFNDAKNFREIFKKKMGVTPKQYMLNM